MNTLTLDPSKTALILVDLQNAIVGRSVAPHSADDIVKRGAAIAAAFRSKDAMVVYINVNVADFLQLEVDSPSFDPKAPPLPPSASEIAPSAGFQKGDVLVTKRHWGAFEGTDLEAQLRARGIETIVITGIATNFGVESTARSAAGRGFNLVFVEDAMGSMSAELHQFPVSYIFPRIGRVRSTEEVIAALA
jgi:nicotinamidase-related amidase